MSYTELGGLVLGSRLVAALICTLLHRIAHHDRFRRSHEVGYAVFLQLGVIFAVLLAFVFNGVWSDYNMAAQAIGPGLAAGAASPPGERDYAGCGGYRGRKAEVLHRAHRAARGGEA